MLFEHRAMRSFIKPDLIFHSLYRDGHPWACIEPVPQGSEQERWISDWLDREAKRLSSTESPHGSHYAGFGPSDDPH